MDRETSNILAKLEARIKFIACCNNVSYGEAAPTSVPNKIGGFYIDTLAEKLYFSIGTSSSSDWKLAN